MKRLSFKPKERDLISAAYASGAEVQVKGKDLRYARSLAARGYGQLIGSRFHLAEAGRAAWVAVKDSCSDGITVNKKTDSLKPETWGLHPDSRKRKQMVPPIEMLYRSNAISEEALTLSVQLVRGFQILTSGTGYRSVRIGERVDCEHGVWTETAEEFEGRLLSLYEDYRAFVLSERIPMDAVLDIMVYDRGFRDVDKAYHRRTGWSRAMMAGLLMDFTKHRGRHARKHREYAD